MVATLWTKKLDPIRCQHWSRRTHHMSRLEQWLGFSHPVIQDDAPPYRALAHIHSMLPHLALCLDLRLMGIMHVQPALFLYRKD